MAIYRARALCYDASRGFAGWTSASATADCATPKKEPQVRWGGEGDSGMIVRELCVLPGEPGSTGCSLFFNFFEKTQRRLQYARAYDRYFN